MNASIQKRIEEDLKRVQENQKKILQKDELRRFGSTLYKSEK